MKPNRPHGVLCIQVEQQMLHKSGVNWEFIVPALALAGLWAGGETPLRAVLQCTERGLWAQKPVRGRSLWIIHRPQGHWAPAREGSGQARGLLPSARAGRAPAEQQGLAGAISSASAAEKSPATRHLHQGNPLVLQAGHTGGQLGHHGGHTHKGLWVRQTGFTPLQK